MAGLQGAGKTTSVGKLAKFLAERQKKKVMVVSADVYRPAAIKQLETIAEQVGVEFSHHLLNKNRWILQMQPWLQRVSNLLMSS